MGGDINLYAYVANAPSSYVDPSGRGRIPGGHAILTPNPTLNTTVCDGKGGVAIQIGDPKWLITSTCAMKCLLAHEGMHVWQILQTSPTICAGQPAGVTIGTANSAEGHWTSEAEAYGVEADCLAGCPCDRVAAAHRRDQVIPLGNKHREALDWPPKE
jgi:hypothetical protein